jgi:hypothetical protein
MPAQDDLRRGLAVLGRAVGDDRVSQRAAAAPSVAGRVDEDAADRRPALGADAELGVGVAQGGLREVRVQLDLG